MACSYPEGCNCGIGMNDTKHIITKPKPELGKAPESTTKQSPDNIVKINVINDVTCELYAPDGTHIGHIPNQYTFNDVRIQIKKNKLSGYYVLWVNKEGIAEKIDIDVNGRLFFPDGFYDLFISQLRQL